MSQRDSGYERKERDLYETPEWVTKALVPHIPAYVKSVYEPAAGNGKMIRALGDAGYVVHADDVSEGRDFLQCGGPLSVWAIITNPPYVHASEFIEQALMLMRPVPGLVAMLLGNDFDHAKTRQHFFSGCPAFAKKVVLTKRIKWFDGPVPCKHCGATGQQDGIKCKPCNGKGEKVQGPSENHAWFIWDWTHHGAPTLAYGP